MGDNYREKQHTKQCGIGCIVHNPKPNGYSKSRPAPAEDSSVGIDQRNKAANKTKFWNDVLGEGIKKVLKRGY